MMRKKILKVKKGFFVCVCVLKMFVISFNEILKFQKKKRKRKEKGMRLREGQRFPLNQFGETSFNPIHNDL